MKAFESREKLCTYVDGSRRLARSWSALRSAVIHRRLTFTAGRLCLAGRLLFVPQVRPRAVCLAPHLQGLIHLWCVTEKGFSFF